MPTKNPDNICKGCGFPYYTRNVYSDIKGYCSQGCLRAKARKLGWKEKSGKTILEFMVAQNDEKNI